MMSAKYTPISAVSGGRKNLKMCASCSHLGGRIHATARKDLVAKFRSMVQEGGTYQLENAIVGFNESPYKVTSHKHKLKMMHNSTFTKVHSPSIPMNVFKFKPFNEILSSTVEEVSTGAMGVANAFNGTKLILNGDLPDVAAYMTRSASLSDDLLNTNRMTIESMIESTELYVAISRVTSRGGLKILINDDGGNDTDVASSVVYREVFRNV
ncbi:DUF223 domain protein [Medicago truncatula]|uniref:DUF223 domain protein n=1 Tax=Medicago truncatula TaxID=3880 RepID=G7IC95_MEDTR|nr:DUF223 domain protein [Medicago truncatula]